MTEENNATAASNQNEAQDNKTEVTASEDKTEVKAEVAAVEPVKKPAKKVTKKKAVAKSKKPATKTAKAKPQSKAQNNDDLIRKIVGQTTFAPTTNPKAMEKMMTKNKAQIEKMTQEAANMSREGFDAFFKSTSIFAKGYEELVRTSMTLAQDAAEKQAQFVKEALSTKTLNEWAEVQNKIAQNNFDDFMTGATKISELSVKVLSESAEPLNDQLNKTMIKATDTLAA